MSSFLKVLAPEAREAILAEFKGSETAELERTLDAVFPGEEVTAQAEATEAKAE